MKTIMYHRVGKDYPSTLYTGYGKAFKKHRNERRKWPKLFYRIIKTTVIRNAMNSSKIDQQIR